MLIQKFNSFDRQWEEGAEHGFELLLSSSVIRTAALADMAGCIVGATRLTDVTDAIIGPPALANMVWTVVRTTDMSDAVVCAATPCGVSRGIVRSAYAEGAVRCSAGADACAAIATYVVANTTISVSCNCSTSCTFSCLSSMQISL